MNILFLMQYVSRQLHTLVRRYDYNGNLIEEVCDRKDLADTLSSVQDSDNHSLRQVLLSPDNTDVPKIFTGPDHISYASVPAEESIFVIGPVILSDNARSRFVLPESCNDTRLPDILYYCNAEELVNILLLIYNLFHEKTLSPDETLSLNFLKACDTMQIFQSFSDIIFDNIESASRHNPYDQEVREFSSIRNGNLELLKKSWEEDYIGKAGTLAKNKLRNYQNIAIVLVTLSARAGIEGGVHPETAFSLSDSYIQKIEEVSNPDAAIQLGKQAEMQYATLVHELKSNRKNLQESANSHILRCKDYIFAHLHEKIRISDIAKNLFLNTNYLSDLFKKEEGITIAEYIWKEKLKLVKNMLIYSTYSHNEIAAYLGFCSQSHLGRQFKKTTGLTLRKYREMYGVLDFRN